MMTTIDFTNKNTVKEYVKLFNTDVNEPYKYADLEIILKGAYHFWIENKDGTIYDPCFTDNDYTKLLSIKGDLIHKPIYKEFNTKLKNAVFINLWNTFLKDIFVMCYVKKNDKLKAVFNDDKRNKDILDCCKKIGYVGRCGQIAYAYYQLNKKKGCKLKIGSVGMLKKNKSGIHYFWG